MAGVAFVVEGDGVGFATESYATSALYTTLANLSGALWRIRRVNSRRHRHRHRRLRRDRHLGQHRDQHPHRHHRGGNLFPRFNDNQPVVLFQKLPPNRTCGGHTKIEENDR
jgi:hypothetical protein